MKASSYPLHLPEPKISRYNESKFLSTSFVYNVIPGDVQIIAIMGVLVLKNRKKKI
jgi:hypothetical protein